MSGSLQMAIFFLIVFIPKVFEVAGASKDDCPKSSACREVTQSSNRGYPGFNVSCTGNETALELPHTPIKIYVSHIDFDAQRIQVKIPDNEWFQRKPILEMINLSNSPFRFTYGFSPVTLLKCSGQPSSQHMIPIISGPSYKISAISSYSHIEKYLEFVSCSKMYDFHSPSDPNDERNLMGPFSLTWSKIRCPQCEEILRGDKLKKIGAKHEDECFRRFKQSKGPSVKAIAFIAGSTVGFFIILLVVITICYLYTLEKKHRESQLRIEKFLEDYTTFKPSRYAYADIKKITEQFKNKLGQGAYGTVFKGKLSKEILVAVKILNNTDGNGEEFINEVATMGKIHHVNIVRLVGYCAEGFRRALVYEFLPNDSLEKYISHTASGYSLSWEKLRDIALGTAEGIEYLHQGCNQRILHFDIKPHNILLDQNFCPKICDFGLAKLCSRDQSIVSMSTARGTIGYIAPEVFSRNFGNVSYKADVYSFGMLLLEMVGGRKINTDAKEENGAHEVYYPEWIYNLLEEGEDLRIQIEEEEDAKIAKKLAIVGLWCIQWHPIGRPTMKVVVQMLKSGEDLAMPPNPFASTGPSMTMSKRPVRRSPLELEAIAE